MKKIFTVLNIGILLFVLYLVQYFLPVKWEWLYLLQEHNQMYKRCSGLAVFLLIVFQWVLTLTRVVKSLRKYSIKLTDDKLYYKNTNTDNDFIEFVETKNEFEELVSNWIRDIDWNSVQNKLMDMYS